MDIGNADRMRETATERFLIHIGNVKRNLPDGPCRRYLASAKSSVGKSDYPRARAMISSALGTAPNWLSTDELWMAYAEAHALVALGGAGHLRPTYDKDRATVEFSRLRVGAVRHLWRASRKTPLGPAHSAIRTAIKAVRAGNWGDAINEIGAANALRADSSASVDLCEARTRVLNLESLAYVGVKE